MRKELVFPAPPQKTFCIGAASVLAFLVAVPALYPHLSIIFYFISTSIKGFVLLVQLFMTYMLK